jgi:DNA-binding SARP family transcriptional activator
VHVRGSKQQVLLALLALSPGRTVSSEHLIDALWGETPPATAETGLRVHVARLRAILSAVPPPTPQILHHPPGYTLTIEAERIDVVRFERLLGEAATAEPDAALGCLDTALALWRGEPFGGNADLDPLRIEAERLSELHESALEDRADVLLRLGRPGAAVSQLEALVSQDPLRERRSMLLMLALYRCGRQADALRVHRELREVLADELGLTPSPELQAVERAILVQDPALDLAPAHRGPAETSMAAGLPWWLDSALRNPIRGRDELLTDVINGIGHEGVRHESDPAVRVVLFRGDAGVGKSRLLAELARRMTDQGARVLAGWCDPEGTVPFRPLMEAFRQVVAAGPSGWPSDVVEAASRVANYLTGAPDLRLRADPETDRLRFFEGMAKLLREAAASCPLVLAIDDAQWLDPSSATLLRYLLRQPTRHLVVLAVCFRSDPSEHTDAWTRTLNELQRQETKSLIDVPELEPEATARLVSDAAAQFGVTDPDTLAAKVFPVTGGNPLFVREVVMQVAMSGAGRSRDGTGAHDSIPLPATILAAVDERLRGLEPSVRLIVNAAAVVGQEFFLDDVARVAACSPETALAGLDDARPSRLIVEVPASVDRFAFRHALLREAVHDLMSRSRKVRLHLAAGMGLQTWDDMGSVLARAFHLLEAVPVCSAGDAARAAVDAADAALRGLAFEEAVRVAERALALGDPVADDTRFDLLVRLGRAKAYRGEDEASDEAFAAAAAIARTSGDGARLALAALGDDLDTRALTPSPSRLQLLSEALEATKEQESPLRVALASTYVTLEARSLGASRVQGLATDNVALARRLGDPLVLSKALLAWVTCTSTSMDPRVRLAVTTEALEHAESAGHASRAARARLLRVGALLRLAQFDEALLEHARYRSLAESTRIPRHLWHADVTAAAFGRLQGRFADAQDFAASAAARGQRAGIPEAGMALGVHMFFVHLHTGRLAELRPSLDAYAELRPDLRLWALGAGLAARADDDRAAARRVLDEFLTAMPGLDQDDEFWSNQLVLAAQLAWELDAEPEVADALAVRLRRCSGQFEVFGASSGTLGPVDRALGLLAALRGDHDGSSLLLGDALKQCKCLDASPWLVWVGADLASEFRILDRGLEAQRLGATLAPVAANLNMATHVRRLQAT